MAKKKEELTEEDKTERNLVIAPALLGVPLTKIREAYFKNKVPAMLDEMLASGALTDENAHELMTYLEGIKSEKENVVQLVVDTFGGKILNIEDAPPTVKELMEGIAWTQDEEERAMKVVAYIESELNNLRQNVASKTNIPQSYWLDTSAKFLSFEIIINRYYIYKTQLYHGRITDIIDNSGCSRLEAENRAKLTKEYADYKMLQRIVGDQNLTGIIERFENLAKKYDAKG